ncbi:response regulator [Methylobacterium sp. CM6247]
MSDSRPLAILIAENDPVVRMAIADILEDLDYQVIEVRDATEALAVLQGPATVHMLITGRSIVGDGVALAYLVRHRWPSVAIIVTSGAGAELQNELPPGTRLLRKPYKFADLVQEVESGLVQVRDKPSAAPVVPSGVPPHRGLGHGVGAIAAPSTEPDKT